MLFRSAIAEETKRTTTSGGDAASSGMISLYGIQRDIRQSGYGINDSKIIGCNVTLRSGVTLNSMAPVTINHASIPAGDTNTDTLLVVYANTNGSPQGDGITSQSATNTYVVQTPSAFSTNEYVIAAPQTRASPCNLTLDRVVSTNLATQSVTVTTGVASMSNGTLFNLGLSPKIYAYAIRSGNLTQCDFVTNNCASSALTTDKIGRAHV